MLQIIAIVPRALAHKSIMKCKRKSIRNTESVNSKCYLFSIYFVLQTNKSQTIYKSFSCSFPKVSWHVCCYFNNIQRLIKQMSWADWDIPFIISFRRLFYCWYWYHSLNQMINFMQPSWQAGTGLSQGLKPTSRDFCKHTFVIYLIIKAWFGQ